MGKKGRPSKAQASANLELKEAEIKKIEELNRREQRALDERAELIRRRRSLDDAEGGVEEPGIEESPFANLDPGFVEALDSLSSEGRMMIYKEDRTGLSKVAEYPVLDSDTMERQLENVAHEHGGGNFMVRLIGPNGKIARQKSFRFDPKAYAKEDKPADGMGNMSAMMNFLIESRKESADLLRTFILAQSRQAPAQGLDLEKAISLGLFKDKSPADMKGMMELFTTALTWGKELAAGRNPGEEGEDGGLMKNLVQPFLAVLSQIQAKSPARPALPKPGATMKPLDGGQPVPASQPVQEAVVDPSIIAVKNNFFYKMYVPTILKAMVDKTDVDDVADDILRTVPSTHHGMIEKYASMPDVVDFLAAFEPSVKDHAEWIKAVAASIVDALAEDEAGEESPDGLSPNGHSVDPVPVEAVKPGA